MERKKLVAVQVLINYPFCFAQAIDKVFCSSIQVNSSITTKEDLSGVYEASKVDTTQGDDRKEYHVFYWSVFMVQKYAILRLEIFPVYYQSNGTYFLAHVEINEDS